jgi:hypothetical protein
VCTCKIKTNLKSPPCSRFANIACVEIVFRLAYVYNTVDALTYPSLLYDTVGYEIEAVGFVLVKLYPLLKTLFPLLWLLGLQAVKAKGEDQQTKKLKKRIFFYYTLIHL